MDDLALAASLVRDAGQLAAAHARATGCSTQHKTSVSDVVSAADHAAEELIGVPAGRASVRTTAWSARRARRGPATRTWFVDPVDGTYNFLSGLPIWCAALALRGRRRSAARRGLPAGARRAVARRTGPPDDAQRRPVAPLENRPLAQVSIASYLHPTTLPDDTVRVPLLRAVQDAATVRMLGSGSIELASVASGRLGAWVQYATPALGLAARCRAGPRLPAASPRSSPRTGTTGTSAGSRQAVDEIAADRE